MGAAVDADDAMQGLEEDLANGLVTGYPEDKLYIPRSCLQKRVTRATIKRCLPDARDELLDFIASTSRKLFAIILYSRCLPRRISLRSALQTCSDKCLTDAGLPLPWHTEQCHCTGDRSTCRHKVALDVLGKWSVRGWEQFYANQWKFLGLEFETGVFDYKLDEQRILPIKLLDGHNEGFFGEVKEGELNQDHAKGSERGDIPRRVAIKVFKDFHESDHQGLAARHAWEMEVQNLHELSKQNHDHLVHRIAAVTHGKKFLILSDWANGGDLKRFWEEEPKPVVGPDLVHDVVAQLRGLASAIRLMHHGSQERTLSQSNSPPSSMPSIPTPIIISPDAQADRTLQIDTAVENSNWRHGDLKPENILRFLKANELIGTLRISDLGLAKQHPVSTGLRKLPSSSTHGTPAYEPPEAMTMLQSPRSRLYDIWSFGCVMLEFIVWLLYGHQGLKDLWELPVERDGTRFWSRLPAGMEPGAEVNRSVAQVMDKILTTNALCRAPSAIRDLVLLIKDRVLVPALPDVRYTVLQVNRRVRANVLLEELEGIEKKTRSREYCCPARPEHGARLPAVSRPVMRNISDSLRPPPVTHGNGAANLQVPAGAARAQRVNPPG